VADAKLRQRAPDGVCTLFDTGSPGVWK
jgi:hypothetical protein